MVTAETLNVKESPPPATAREQGHIAIAPRPVRLWYVQPVTCWDAWAPGAGWSACIACHLDGQPVLLPDGRHVEGVNPRHLHILMLERWPESERCEMVDGEWRAI